MKFYLPASFSLGALAFLGNGSILVRAGQCWPSMANGICTSQGGKQAWPPANTPAECLQVSGYTDSVGGLAGSGLPIDLPFYEDDNDNCEMVPGAEPLGNCCIEASCGDCPFPRYNPSQCPEVTNFFTNYYLGDNGANCVELASIVGMNGDPHVKTWSGSWFDYMGECDLVLTHAPNFDGKGTNIDLHVRTTIRYDYSYIESVALRIGQNILEVESFGQYALDGIDHATLKGVSLAGYPVHHRHPNDKEHVFDIVLGPKENITLSTFKDLVAVSIQAGVQSAKYFGNSVGIMGSFKGDLLARDGVTIMEDKNAFGQEWQVNGTEPMLFRTARNPQYPRKCSLPSPKTAGQRRLGETIAREAAEKACAHLTGSTLKNCIFDVMAVGDIDIAQAGAF